MVELSFIGQPFPDEGQTGVVINGALDDPANKHAWFATAWAKRSGLSRLANGLQAFRERGGFAEAVVGVDEGGATIEGLRLALNLFDAVHVFHDPGSRTFHPKLYAVEGDASATICLGSGNLTRGGLYTNYEGALVARLDLRESVEAGLRANVRAYYDALLAQADACKPLTDELIEEMIRDPRLIVLSEREANRHRARRRAAASKGSAFGDPVQGLANAPSPDVSPVDDEAADEDSEVPPEPKLDATGGISEPTSPKVIKRWYKQLPQADSQQLDPRTSSRSAAVTVVQASHPIDSGTFFRDELFGDAEWSLVSGGKEQASLTFDVQIPGVSPGLRTLTLVHDPAFEADQGNRTTLLRWGEELNEYLRENDHTGDFVTLEQLSDGTYRLTISEQPTGSFAN